MAVGRYRALRRHPSGVGWSLPVRTPAWRRRADAGISSALERLTCAVGEALDVPAVLASLVYRDRDLITSSYGVAAPLAMLLSHAFRQRVVAIGHTLVIPDARRDALLRLNRAVRDGSVRACVGMRFGTTDGEAVGTLCAMDPTPRLWTTADLTILDQLSGLLVSEIEFAADVQLV